MGKKPNTPCVTRVQCAVSATLFPRVQKLLHKRPSFFLINDLIASGADLLDAIHASRPDILVLDLELTGLDLPGTYCALSQRRFPPYILAIASCYQPHLAEAERHRLVKGTLLHRLVASPLLVYVLKGIAEGHEYFTPDSALNFIISRLTPDETVLLALMAIGVQPGELVPELDCSLNAIYIAQSQLRRKLEVDTNEQAILLGVRRKLVGMLTLPSDREIKETA